MLGRSDLTYKTNPEYGDKPASGFVLLRKSIAI